MAAFILNSDKQFMSPTVNGKEVYVYEYQGNTNDFGIIQSAFNKNWRHVLRVGPTSEKYTAVQVFGVTIQGDKLGELAKELRGIEEGNNVNVYVNRLGQCIITRINHSSIKFMRVNDYFAWSKYGVAVPPGLVLASVWNKLDMSTGETLVDVEGIVKAAEELRRSLAECKKELAECRKELEWRKKNEVLWSRLVEDKVNRLLAFKAALRDLLA